MNNVRFAFVCVWLGFGLGCTGLDPILAPDASLFTCGTKTCNSQNEFCRTNGNGSDGGDCQDYPDKCTEDGGTPTCACLQCTSCTQSGATITASCP